MIKIMMVLGNGVWDAEDGNGKDAEDGKSEMSITDSLSLEPGQTARMSHMTPTEVGDFVFKKVSTVFDVQYIFVTLEDTSFYASRFDGGFRLFSADRFSGKSVGGSASNKQLAALLYLACAGDDAARSEELYPIAEAVVDGWPRECRPMP